MQRSKTILILSLALIVVFSILLHYYWSSLGFLSVFVNDALWASVLATIILVFINAVSIWQNRQTVKEMEKARKSEFLTHVRVELSWYVPAFLVLKISNFGKGPATHIKAKIKFLPSNFEKNWTEGTLAPNESINIFLPDGNMHNVQNTITRIVVKGNYQDIFGQSYEIAEEIPVKEFIDETMQLNPVYDQNKLVHALNELNNELRREMSRDFGGIIRTNQKLVDEISRIKETLDKMERKQESQNSEKY